MIEHRWLFNICIVHGALWQTWHETDLYYSRIQQREPREGGKSAMEARWKGEEATYGWFFLTVWFCGFEAGLMLSSVPCLLFLMHLMWDAKLISTLCIYRIMIFLVRKSCLVAWITLWNSGGSIRREWWMPLRSPMNTTPIKRTGKGNLDPKLCVHFPLTYWVHTKAFHQKHHLASL